MADLNVISRTLELTTQGSCDDVLSRVRKAIERIGRVGILRPEVTQAHDDGLVVELKRTVPLIGSEFEYPKFVVTAEPDGESTRVTVGAVDFKVYQERLFFFIPFGPKRVPGSDVYSRCLEQIESAL